MNLTISTEELNDLLTNKFLKPAQNGYQLTITNLETNKDITVDIKVQEVSTKTVDNVEEWIDDWRKAWAGKREKKSMGDRNKCILNMTDFLRSHKYSVQDIYEARDKYIESHNGNYSTLRQADYFIKKRDDETRLITSELLSVCQELEIIKAMDLDEPSVNIFTDL